MTGLSRQRPFFQLSIRSALSFLTSRAAVKKKKIESERERERARSTMAENVHYIHADRPLVTHRTIKSKLNPWYIVRPRFKMERIFRDSRNSMGGQLNGQLNRKKKLGISSETLAFSFFSLFFIFHHVPFHSIRTRFPSVYNLFRLLFFFLLLLLLPFCSWRKLSIEIISLILFFIGRFDMERY